MALFLHVVESLTRPAPWVWVLVFICVVGPGLQVEWMRVWCHEGVTLKQFCLKLLLYFAIGLPIPYGLLFHLYYL